MNGDVKSRYFKIAAEFRRWLAAHHASEPELIVGFYRKASGKPSVSYQEAVDEALCYGWIDGVKKRVDEERYTHRFTPRRDGSIWSVVNTKRMKELIDLKRVTKAGLAAFERRDPRKTGSYSFESRRAAFDAAIEREFTKHSAAWAFFRAQPPGYQRLVTHYVMSAKQPDTRLRRLAAIVTLSADGKRLR